MNSRALIAIMLGIPLVFLVLVELIIMGPLKQDNYFISSLVNARLGLTECVIVGDSHPASAFRDVLEEQCDNLATGGTSTWMVIDLVDSVLRNNNLKTAIISVGPHYFSPYRINNKSDAFKDIAEWLRPLPNPLSQNEAVIGFLVEWVKGNLGLAKEHTDNDLKIAAKRIRQHTPITDFSSGKMAQEYKKMITQLVANGVHVCVLRTPVISQYDEHMSKTYSKKEWVSFVEQIKLLGAHYLSYNDILDEYHNEWFANPEHLNKEGAKIFAPKAFDYCLAQKIST